MQAEIPTSFGDGRFIVKRELGRGGMGVVYEAFDKEREMRVALKTLLHMDADSLYYFKREFRALHDIVHPNLCSFMELIQDDNSWFLTMEHIKGVDFLSYVKDPDSRFDEERLRKSLAGLCSGLGALHAAGKVHRDIKPSNVMITSEERVVVLDFGLVVEKHLSRQTEAQSLLGTVAYMAPEQADSGELGPQADWYSVGTMMYEALTGKLPFQGPPLKVLLEKQTSSPIRPRDVQPDLPQDLETLCFDLLSRDPQSRPNPGDFFSLFDVYNTHTSHSIATNIPSPTQAELFVGRQSELQFLKEAYQKTRKGSFSAVVIEGVSGVGKSALMNRFSEDVRSDYGFVPILSGQCYENEIAPFQAFDGIVDSFIRYSRNIPEDKARGWLPHRPDLMVRLFPTLNRSALFSCIPIIEREIEDPFEFQRRSFESFKELLMKLGYEQPLIVIMDDMQWSDPDSIALLEYLVGKDGAPSMLLIILSRYAKGSAESVRDWGKLFNQAPTRIHLKPLSMSESTELTCLFLNREQVSIDVDPELIAAEAAGHPMYIGELVQHLTANQGGEWKSLSLDDSIWHRVGFLPGAAKKILQIVCVAGAPILSDQLLQLSHVRPEEYFGSISLLKSCKFIKGYKSGNRQIIEPYHDRVRESVLVKVEDHEESERIHYKIGQFLLDSYSEDELEESIFEVVRHFQAGNALLSNKIDIARYTNLCLLAGKRARNSSAYKAALKYFLEGISLLGPDGWIDEYTLSISLHDEAAEAALLCSDYELMTHLTAQVEKHANKDVDKVNACRIQIEGHTAQNRPEDAIQTGLLFLRRFGLRFPQNPSKFQVIQGIIQAKIALKTHGVKNLVDLPDMDNPQQIVPIVIMRHLSTPAYISNPYLMVLLIFKQVRMIIRHGNSDWSASIFASFGLSLCGVIGDIKTGYELGQIALQLLEKYPNTRQQCRTRFVANTFIKHWKDHLRTTLEPLEQAYKLGLETGDLEWGTHAGHIFCEYSFFAGDNLAKLEATMAAYSKEIGKNKQKSQHNYNEVFRQTVLNLLGRNHDPRVIKGEAFNDEKKLQELIENNDKLGIFAIYLLNTLTHYLFYDYYNAVRFAEMAGQRVESAPGMFAVTRYHFYDSLARLAIYDQSDGDTQRAIIRRIKKTLKKINKWARFAPANHQHVYHLILAEYNRISRHYKEAVKHYELAATLAEKNGFINDMAISLESTAHFYFMLGNQEAGDFYIDQSLCAYSRWGAFAKVDHVKEKFGIE